jgi:hypothetical protein
MERALPPIILPRAPRSRATEIPMSRRASSSGPLMSGAACVLLAAAAVGYDSPAYADCIVQPNRQAPDGTHWSLHFDRVQNRRCWILVDATGHDISTYEPAATSTLSSFQSFLGNITGTNPPPQPQEAPASPAVAPPGRAPHPHVVNVHRVERPAVRPEQKTEAHPAKHEMSPPERDALFEEFLRWHESRKITGADKK